MKLQAFSIRLWAYAALLLMVLSFFCREHSMDIHMHGASVFISQTRLLWAAALLLLCLWAFYKLCESFLFSRWLMALHMVLTLLATLILAAFPLWSNGIYLLTSGRYFDYSVWQGVHHFDNIQFSVKWIWLAVLLLQLPFVLNMAGGLLKRILSIWPTLRLAFGANKQFSS